MSKLYPAMLLGLSLIVNFFGTCYLINGKTFNMREALQRCNGSFIKLNQTDNSTVDLVNQFKYSQVWTDLKKTVTGWKWLDGTMANVTVTNMGSPRPSHGIEVKQSRKNFCVAADEKLDLYEKKCDNKYPYICQIKENTTEDQEVDTKKPKLINTPPLSWYEAEGACVNLTSEKKHALVMHVEDQRDSLQSILKIPGNRWIGLIPAFVWVSHHSKEKFPENKVLQKGVFSFKKKCAIITSQNELIEEDCTENHNYICLNNTPPSFPNRPTATSIPQTLEDDTREGKEGFIAVGIVGSAIVLVIIALFFMARRTTKQSVTVEENDGNVTQRPVSLYARMRDSWYQRFRPTSRVSIMLRDLGLLRRGHNDSNQTIQTESTVVHVSNPRLSAGDHSRKRSERSDSEPSERYSRPPWEDDIPYDSSCDSGTNEVQRRNVDPEAPPVPDRRTKKVSRNLPSRYLRPFPIPESLRRKKKPAENEESVEAINLPTLYAKVDKDKLKTNKRRKPPQPALEEQGACALPLDMYDRRYSDSDRSPERRFDHQLGFRGSYEMMENSVYSGLNKL